MSAFLFQVQLSGEIMRLLLWLILHSVFSDVAKNADGKKKKILKQKFAAKAKRNTVVNIQNKQWSFNVVWTDFSLLAS